MAISDFVSKRHFEKVNIEEYTDIYNLNLNENYIFVSFFYNSKAEYPHYVLVTPEKKGVSLPKHLNKMFDDISNDKETVEAVKNGKIAFNIYEYEKEVQKKVKKFRSINLVEV